jgi:hypothetical protein
MIVYTNKKKNQEPNTKVWSLPKEEEEEEEEVILL